MFARDYNLYAPKIEPILVKSFEILKKYRDEQEVKTAGKRVSMLRALAFKQEKARLAKSLGKPEAALVDQHVPLNPGSIKPLPQKFHEGWNLNKRPTPKPTSHKASLLDK